MTGPLGKHGALRKDYPMSKIQLSGNEVKAYWADDSQWQQNTEIVDMTISVDGVEERDVEITSIVDTAVVVISDAWIIRDDWDEARDLIKFIRKWKKSLEEASSVKRLLVSVSDEHFDELIAAIKSVRTAKIVG